MTVTAIADIVMAETDMTLVLNVPGQFDRREILVLRVLVAGPSSWVPAGSCSRFWCRADYPGAHCDRNSSRSGFSMTREYESTSGGP